MIVALELAGAFVLIVGGAIWFTNAVEWLGKRLDLAAGAVGALLAAVGTALPESIIPVVALLNGGGGEQVELAIGAIIGAPFMLATLAMLLITGSSHLYRGRREQGAELQIEADTTRRDLIFFLALFPIGIAVGAIGVATPWRIATAALLLVGYGVYVRITVASRAAPRRRTRGRCTSTRARTIRRPRLQMVLQFVLSLGGDHRRRRAVRDRDRVARRVARRPAARARADPRAAGHRAAGEGQQRDLGAPRQGRAGRREHHRRDGVPGGGAGGRSALVVATSWELDRFAVVAAGRVALAGGAVALWALPRGRGGFAPTAIWAVLFGGFLGYVTFG